MNQKNQYTVFAIGDSALTFDLGNYIDEELNRKVLAMSDWLRQNPFEGMKDLIVAYASITVMYDVAAIRSTYKSLRSAFDFVSEKICLAYETAPVPEHIHELVKIPVCYDPSVGHDLEFVAREKQLGLNDIIRFHTEKTYRVYMIGFLPGFAYMAETDERLTISRKKTPRPVIEAGSVGIAGNQTGIYPIASPGGWQIIGRTPVPMFIRANEEISLLKPGNYVAFYPISKSDFDYLNRKPSEM